MEFDNIELHGNFEMLNCRYDLCSGETLIILSERTDLKICLFQSIDHCD